MNTPEYPAQQAPKKRALSRASEQALAISAVDNIRPSEEAIELMRMIDADEITYEQAIERLVAKARNYASTPPPALLGDEPERCQKLLKPS